MNRWRAINQSTRVEDNASDRKVVKLNLIRRLYESGYSRSEVVNLFRFIDWVMILPEELKQAFWLELKTYEEERRMPYITSVEEIGFARGLQEGEQQGEQRGEQRQRSLIARSLVLKPKILLFDEATSALDNRTQGIVSQSLEQLKVTRIVIAHRLSTIRHADRIYVLDAGRIVQQGTFAQLAQQAGLFAQLIARQMV